MACSSKYINNHKGVKEADSGEDLGGTCKYDVLLKADWHFAGLDERTDCLNIRRCGFFNTVAEFKAAKPTKFR